MITEGTFVKGRLLDRENRESTSRTRPKSMEDHVVPIRRGLSAWKGGERRDERERQTGERESPNSAANKRSVNNSGREGENFEKKAVMPKETNVDGRKYEKRAFGEEIASKNLSLTSHRKKGVL